MSVFTDIQAALHSHLNTMAGKPPIAWENSEYQPTAGTLFARPSLLPGESVQATLGTDGQDSNVGVFQVDIFGPIDLGHGETVAMADTIADHFKRGTYLTYNSRVIRIRSVSRGAAGRDDNWYQIPVEINYIAYTAART